MTRRGRSFAAGALVMLLAQFTLLCAAPFAACTMTSMAAASDVDCCPAGSHPPGQCPLHKREATSSRCRLTCANDARTPFVPGFVGVLTPSLSYSPVLVSAAALLSAPPFPLARTLPPVSPPPKRFA